MTHVRSKPIRSVAVHVEYSIPIRAPMCIAYRAAFLLAEAPVDSWSYMTDILKAMHPTAMLESVTVKPRTRRIDAPLVCVSDEGADHAQAL